MIPLRSSIHLYDNWTIYFITHNLSSQISILKINTEIIHKKNRKLKPYRDHVKQLPNRLL